MGDFLSKPVTEKHSFDEANDKLSYGASSMQGWRLNQEDAHNCIINFDTNTSYFAVYDGHGGPEVALYCSQKLPEFLKTLDDYKNGNFEKALEDAFLQFDETIATKEVKKKLKEIVTDHKEIEEERENITSLYEEARMPIEQVIEKYARRKLLNQPFTLPDSDDSLSNNSIPSTTSTPETSGEVVSSSSCVKDVISSSNDSPNDENPVSSGSTSITINNSDTKVENKVDSPDSSDDTREVCTPSNDSINKESEVENKNGEVESTQNCESSKSDVSSSSTTVPQENGEILKKGKGKALTKTKGVIPKTPTPERPKRSARQYYNEILTLEEGSEEESEDEKDETFEGPDDDSSLYDDDDEVDAPSSNENNSDESSVDDEEEEDDGEEEEDEGDDENAEDDIFLSEVGPGIESGCTAVVAFLRDNELYVANAGDSRCIVCRNGQAIEMSIDHKPDDKPEEARIKKAGGYVDDGRVKGGLNLSRAIGDYGYKKNKELPLREQMITALPDVKRLTIKPGEDEFMVLACDGIWNSLSSQEVVDYVKSRIQEGREKLSQICEEMFDHCLAPNTYGDGTGCDNMTAIIVQFKLQNPKRPSTEPDEPCKRMKCDVTEVSA